MAENSVYRLAVENTFTGNDQIINVFHYKQVAVGGAQPGATELGDEWIADVLPAYRALLSGRITVLGLTIREVTGTEEAEFTVNQNGLLESAADITPLQTAPLISWRTGVAGRSFRGRTYLPPIPETHQDAGNLNSTYVGLMEDFAEAAKVIENAVTVDLFQLGIWSTVEDNAPRVPPVFTPVTAYVIRSVTGGQNRRRQGRGS